MPKAPTIAIVDDDEGVRTSLASLVRSLGYNVRTYQSGVHFLQDSLDPDCMIADIQMRVMTGDEMQALLIATGRRFPIVFMTAFPTESMRQRVMEAGACCYLSKPASGDEIIRCLEDALADGHPQRSQ
ncbi:MULTISPECIES: response regulator [unclassified Afipia]|uniref:response regulator transcription factor n=1 Tax=unclassified Afipia TaxID=2642050 RepID=UPI0004647B79|nr:MULTISPECIES: response regulator [unclassified Afipia]